MSVAQEVNRMAARALGRTIALAATSPHEELYARVDEIGAHIVAGVLEEASSPDDAQRAIESLLTGLCAAWASELPDQFAEMATGEAREGAA